MDVKIINKVTTEVTPATAINLCNQDDVMGEEIRINFTYIDLRRQMMILDIGAPISLADVSWMSQYLKDMPDQHRGSFSVWETDHGRMKFQD